MITINYYYTSDDRWFKDLCESFKNVSPDARIENNSLLLGTAVGKGKIDFIEVVEGLGVLCVDYTFAEDVNWICMPSALNDYFMINFNVGDEAFKIKNAQGVEMNSGESLSSSIFYSSSGAGFECCIPQNKRIRFIQLIVSNKWMLNKIHYYNLPIDKNFHDYSSNNSFQEVFNLNLDCKTIAEEILSIDFSSAMARLKIKGDVLELISRFYSKISYALLKQKKIIADDIEKIKSEMQELGMFPGVQWPSLSSLIKKCDMSKTKFTVLFNQIYGKGYLEVCIEARMKEACSMIKNNVPVSEAGWQVGYTSLGHFSKMFKKITGVLPSEIINIDKNQCNLNCRNCTSKIVT